MYNYIEERVQKSCEEALADAAEAMLDHFIKMAVKPRPFTGCGYKAPKIFPKKISLPY